MQEIADWLEKLGMSEYSQREGCHGELDPTPGITAKTQTGRRDHHPDS